MGNTQPSPYTHPDQSEHGEDQLIQESQASADDSRAGRLLITCFEPILVFCRRHHVACSSPELYDLRVTRRGWPADRYGRFVARALTALLPAEAS